jgi:hypothetical protein
MPRTAKTFEFDFTGVSSAIDYVTVQGSNVTVQFVGNDKTYEFTWKPASSKLVSKLEELQKNPESFSLGKFSEKWRFAAKNCKLTKTIKNGKK